MGPLKNLQETRKGFGEDYPDKNQIKINQWRQLLNSRKQQNVLLKNRLSDILKDKYDQTLLVSLEEFQSEFIGEDVVIDSLRKDVDVLESLLAMMAEADQETKSAIIATCKRLDRDISKSTSRFRSIKAAFKDFCHNVFKKKN